MNSLDYFFNPRTVAIIGASRTPGKVGRIIIENFFTNKFPGKIYPINPNVDKLMGLDCYSSVKKIKDSIDLGIICVPTKFVVQSLKECGEKKVKSVIIISAGFDEIGNKTEGEKLRKTIKKYPKMRVIGPNCLGVLNMKHKIDTLFLPIHRLSRPKPGDISFISQSGALGSAVLDWAAMEDYGIAKFISYGNAEDVDETDLLEYLIHDKETKVIVMYIEGIKNGRKFFELTKKYGTKKPIVVLKGGSTEGGSKAASSHTAALAGSIQVFNALIKQTGLIKAETLLEAFNFARILETQPEPKGKKVQIITDGGGYGVLAADAIMKHGLELATMSKDSIQRIRKKVPPYVVLKNPIDLTGDTDNDRYLFATEEALKDNNVDMIILIILFQVPSLNSSIVDVISELNRKKKKPLISISVGGSYSELHQKALEKEGVISFDYPHNAAKSLRALVDYYFFKNNKKKKKG